MMMLKTIAAVLMGVLKLFSLWFALTGALFWKRPVPYPRKPPQTRFACLIAARNEERVIRALICSLWEQRYPRALYDVYVIPNNCTDGTEQIALASGAKLLHCPFPVRCKGDALRQAMEAIPLCEYDAVCVFDADNIVHPDHLSRLNDAFAAGVRVAISSIRAKNPYETWVAGCYGIYYAVNELFFNRSRASLGLSAKLVGTGFAVHRDILRQMGGWNTKTMAEDAEFSAVCAQLGERVHWVPEAIAYDEAPRSFRISLRQRRRWCSGIMDVAQDQLPGLLRILRGKARVRTIDMIAFLCLPFVQACSPFLAAAAVFPRILTDAPAAIRALLSGVAFGSFAAAGLAAAVCRSNGLRPVLLWKSILMFPVFMASWAPVQVVSLFRRKREWVEIPHWGNLKADGGKTGTARPEPDVPILPDPSRAVRRSRAAGRGRSERTSR